MPKMHGTAEKGTIQMTEAYIKAEYLSADKPFTIEGRESHCGGTDYWTIAMINTENARLLVESGMSWRHGEEPDWEKHHAKIKRMFAENDLKKAQKALDELNKEAVK